MSVERARYSTNNTWIVYQGGSTLTNPGRFPNANFTYSRTDTTVTFDATSSTPMDASIGRYEWNFGDGTPNQVGLRVVHKYATYGNWSVRLQVTDALGLRGTITKSVDAQHVNEVPTANIALVQSNRTVTYSAAGSSDPNGGALTYSVDWGDGTGVSTGVTGSHTYSTNGVFAVTLTVTDPTGFSSIASATATPTSAVTTPPTSGGGTSGGGSTSSTPKQPWRTGSPTEGLPSSVRVIKWSTLATSSSDDRNPQRAINRMTQDAVIDITGESLLIPSFQGSGSPNGITSSHLLGFIGGISNGAFNNVIKLDNNAMTAAQAKTVAAQGSGDTSTFSIIRLAAGKRMFMMGVNLVGADQPKISDPGAASQFPTGPARHKGLNVNLADDNSMIQNCLLQGFGSSNGNGPPWEVGSVDSRRSNKFLVRRTEIDGRLPVGSESRPSSTTADPYGHGWKRTGGFQWNADKSPIMTDFSLHDALVSGLTSSIAGVGNNGSNNTENPKFTRVYIEDNSLKGFSGMNFEMVLGPINLDHCTFAMNGTGGQHLQLNPRLTSPKAPNIPTNNFVITEPTWSGLGYNGMFTIGIFNWGSTQTSAPKVIKNGKVLTGKTSNADPAKYYRIVSR